MQRIMPIGSNVYSPISLGKRYWIHLGRIKAMGASKKERHEVQQLKHGVYNDLDQYGRQEIPATKEFCIVLYAVLRNRATNYNPFIQFARPKSDSFLRGGTSISIVPGRLKLRQYLDRLEN
jgi:hypothetical protein